MTTLMQKVAQVAPAKYSFIMKTASEVRQSPFRNEIIEDLDALIKRANQSFMSRVGGAIGPAAAGIGATVATGIAYNLAGDMFDSVKRGITKSRGYKAMLRENPDLAEHPAKDVQKIYSTLHRFNPDFAMDPMVAGSFVRRQAALGEFDTKMLTEAISARKNLDGITNIQMPMKLPWSGSHEREMQGLEKKRLEQATNPELQQAMRTSPQQEATQIAQEKLYKQQAKKLKLDRRIGKMDLEDRIARQAAQAPGIPNITP